MVNASVGRVHATDADEGVNAEISYSVPADIPFVIDEKTGDIKTKVALDYETQKVCPCVAILFKYKILFKNRSSNQR